MGYKVNIYQGSQWVNVLKDAFLEVANTNFSGTDLSAVLDEIQTKFDGKQSRQVVRTSTTYSASAFDVVLADVTLAGFTISLPAGPTGGDVIKIIDLEGMAATNVLTIVPEPGDKIQGSTESLLLDIDGGVLELIYDSINSDWRIDIGGTYLGSTAADALAASYVTVNAETTGSPGLNGGLKVERGLSQDVILHWDETADQWTLTEDGTNYYKIWHEGNMGESSGLDAASLMGRTVNDTGTTTDDLWTAAKNIEELEKKVDKDSDNTITGTHTFNPDTPGAPFVIGANGNKQLVSGLNAEYVNGHKVTVNDTTPASTDAKDIWIEVTP